MSLTIDTESVFKYFPTERTLLGHISWISELMEFRTFPNVQWCDTRAMSAYGSTNGSIYRVGLLQVYNHDVKRFDTFGKHSYFTADIRVSGTPAGVHCIPRVYAPRTRCILGGCVLQTSCMGA